MLPILLIPAAEALISALVTVAVKKILNEDKD